MMAMLHFKTDRLISAGRWGVGGGGVEELCTSLQGA